MSLLETHTIIIVGAVLVSAGIGFFASNRTMNTAIEINTKKELQQKQLVYKLLKKEINQRWKENIRGVLLDIQSRGTDAAVLHGYNSSKLSDYDFFVIKQISENISHYYFLDDEFIFKIIQINAIMKDYQDIQEGANSLSDEIKAFRTSNSANDEIFPEKFDRRVTHYIEQFKILIDEIDNLLENLVVYIDSQTNNN